MRVRVDRIELGASDQRHHRSHRRHIGLLEDDHFVRDPRMTLVHRFMNQCVSALLVARRVAVDVLRPMTSRAQLAVVQCGSSTPL